jgi:uncharacterized protein (TIGR02302 family)
MASAQPDPRRTAGYRRRVWLARAALAFERAWPAAWPTVAVIGLFLALSLLGIWHRLPWWLHGLGLVLFLAALGVAVVRLLPALRWPSRAAGLARIEADSGVRHQPLRALEDRLPHEIDDPLSHRLWEAHRERLLAGLARLRLAPPRSDLPRRDPWALRAALLLLLVVALVDAGPLVGQRLGQAFSLNRAAPPPATPLAITLWVTPPAYTGRAPLSPEQLPAGQAVTVPQGSEALAQLHHLPPDVVPSLALAESETAFARLGEGSAEARLTLDSDGELTIRLGDAPALASWPIQLVVDRPPQVSFDGPPGVTHRRALRLAYLAEDDYGVVEVALVLAPHDRDDESERLTLARPGGQTPRLGSASYLDLTAHPLAGLPVRLRLEAVDGIGQRGVSEPLEITLPEREFRHPLARAIIGERKTLMGAPERQDEVSARLGVLAETPSARQLGATVELSLRSGAARLDNTPRGEAGREGRRAVAELLWDLALFIEDGALSVAERELRELQDALERALLEGADDAELERLMAELEEAMSRYLEELARQAMENAQQAGRQEQQPLSLDPNQLVDRQDLQQMLDRARELMRSGARDAARQMLAELRQMLENLQAMAGQQQMSPQQRSLSDLQKMIQLQRDLLQRSFDMQRREQQGDMQPPGGRQEGNQQEGPTGMPQDGQMGQAAGEQEALRRALGELMRRLGEQGMEIPRSLGQAELEMRGARESLQQGSPGAAAANQAQALDLMQQGGQALLEQLQQQMAEQPGQGPGDPQGAEQRRGRDPLGRSVRNEGGWDTNGELVPEESDLGRARGVLEELFRRSGERNRPPLELEYYDRLLDRF